MEPNPASSSENNVNRITLTDDASAEIRARISVASSRPAPNHVALCEQARKEREMCIRTDMTPLMIAASRGHDDIVKVLLNHGATS